MMDFLLGVLFATVFTLMIVGGVVGLWKLHRWFFYDHIYNSLNVIIYKLENKGK